jgi:hypothetical protein
MFLTKGLDFSHVALCDPTTALLPRVVYDWAAQGISRRPHTHAGNIQLAVFVEGVEEILASGGPYKSAHNYPAQGLSRANNRYCGA